MFVRGRQRNLSVALVLLLSLVLLASFAIYRWLAADLPPLNDLRGYTAAPSSKIYDRHGELLFEMPPSSTGRHSPVPLSEIPVVLRQATIATEDASFYENPGVDGRAIVRALWINLRGKEVLSGGSTITQQMARNVLLSPEERSQRTLTRKLREALLAWRLTRRYSKGEILELYLNETYYGNMAYGVEAAAQAYYGKHVRDLDLAECAMLAGLPQAPALFNPLEDLKAAKARQALVLDLMTKQGYINQEQAHLAQEEKLYFASAYFPIQAPHFVMYVRGLLEQALGLERLEQGGLRIYTTLDLDLNVMARDLVRYRLARLAECNGEQTECPPGGHNVRNAALVALAPQTGEILAMLGSPDYFSARIDGAVNGTTARRQPGSSIKPLTYAAAFEHGELTPATMMLDVPASFVTKEGTPYVPLNYDLRFRGPVRLREALGSSYNLIAVKVLDTIGVEEMTGLARRLGVTTFDEPGRLGLAVTLGGGEVRLLELTAAYAALANGGWATKPVAIQRVEDDQGRILLSSPSPERGTGVERGLDERVAYLITNILSDDQARIPSFGEESVLKLSRPAAVKTGTTTDFRDNWTVGYTANLVVGVWVGNADSEPMWEVTGVSGAAPIWHDFVEGALKGQPELRFQRPSGLTEVEVCGLSGLLPGPDCPHRVTELFLAGTEPTETCSIHQRIALDQATGLRATAETPQERVVERLYSVLPPEAQAWAQEQGIARPPPASGSDSMDATSQASLAYAASRSPPQLVMSRPYAGAVYRLDANMPQTAQRIEVSAWSEAGTELSVVTLLVDGRPLARFDTPPYTAMWQLQPGLHVFAAEGLGPDGRQVVSREVRIEVRE